MINHSVTLHALLSAALFFAGTVCLLLAGIHYWRPEAGFVGVALSFLGNLCYFEGRLAALESRERNAFALGRESVRSIR